jgi:hypothetical protein
MRRMRDAFINGAAIVLAGVAVGVGIWRGAEELALRRDRYAIAANEYGVAVVDVRNGQVQTFKRTHGVFLYQGTDSRGMSEKRSDRFHRMMRHR